MKAITIWPEWAHCIAHRGQNVVNRGRTAPAELIGQRIAIHAGRHIGGRPTKRSAVEGLANMTAEAQRSGVRFGVELDPKTNEYGTRYSPYNAAHRPYTLRPIVCGAIVASATLERVMRTRSPTEARQLKPWAIDRPGFWWFLSDVVTIEPIPWIGWIGPFDLSEATTDQIKRSTDGRFSGPQLPPLDVYDIPRKDRIDSDDDKASP